MSEPIPESIPTSISSRSHRPVKKRALTPSTQQSASVEALFANPERADNVLAVGPKPKFVSAPPEIVANVQGSSAGAGSGEFHVYKASRRREYERLRAMDDEVKEEEAEKEFQERKQRREREDEEKLNKNRAQRAKAKARKEKKKLALVNTDDQIVGDRSESGLRRKLIPAKPVSSVKGNTFEAELHNPPNGDISAGNDGAGITIHDDD